MAEMTKVLFSMPGVVVTQKIGDADDDAEDSAPGDSEASGIDAVVAQNERQDLPCWGCKHCFGDEDNASEQASALYRVYLKGRERVSLQKLAEIISEKQIELYYLPFVNKDGKPSDAHRWSVPEVLRHLQWHMTDPRLADVQAYKRLRALEQQAFDKCAGTKLSERSEVQNLVQIVGLRKQLEKSFVRG